MSNTDFNWHDYSARQLLNLGQTKEYTERLNLSLPTVSREIRILCDYIKEVEGITYVNAKDRTQELFKNLAELEKAILLIKKVTLLEVEINSEVEPDLPALAPATTVESSISTINKEEETVIKVQTITEELPVEVVTTVVTEAVKEESAEDLLAASKIANAELKAKAKVKKDAFSTASINKCEDSAVQINTPITTKGQTNMAIKVNAISDPTLKAQVEARDNVNSTVNTTINTTTEVQTMKPISQQNTAKAEVLNADSTITKVELIVNITMGENNNLSNGTQGVNASKGYIIGTRSAGVIRSNSKDDSAWAEFHIGANKYDSTNGVDPYGRYNNAIWRFTNDKGISKLLSHEEGLKQWANVLQVDVEHIEEVSKSVFIKVQMPETASAISNMLYGGHTSLRSFIITFNGINDEDAAMFKYSCDAYRAANNREDATCLTPVNATVAFSGQVYNLETINTLGANPNSNLKNILCDSVKQKKSFIEVIRTNNSKSSIRREARKEAAAEAATLFDSPATSVKAAESPSTEEVVIPENTTKVTEEIQPQVITEEVTVEVNAEPEFKPSTESASEFKARRTAEKAEKAAQAAQADKEEVAEVISTPEISDAAKSDFTAMRAQIKAAKAGLVSEDSFVFATSGRIVTAEAKKIAEERAAEEAILDAMDDM